MKIWIKAALQTLAIVALVIILGVLFAVGPNVVRIALAVILLIVYMVVIFILLTKLAHDNLEHDELTKKLNDNLKKKK